MTVTLGLELFAVSLTAAVLAFIVVSYWPVRRNQTTLFADEPDAAVLIFDDDRLIDATASARALLSAVRQRGSAWQRFLAFASPRFPDVAARLALLPEVGAFTLPAHGSEPMTLHAEWRGGLRRITLVDSHRDTAIALYDVLAQRAQDDELAALRLATERAPFPMWREDGAGSILWVNDRYMALAQRAGLADDSAAWPPPVLFADADTRGRVRVPVVDGAAPLWFDRAVVASGAMQLFYALPADAAMTAETALRDFVQTLGKTFAHLPIGLAVFDRSRRLHLFNPALTDLTRLPVEFLSARPTLAATLDAMRDRRMVPEPKDYKGWRRRLSALEAAAAAGQFEETWSLAAGKTYRVTGRPHPEGALALMIEDISEEMGRVRTFRADLALGQAVLDTLDDAIAVFGADGTLAMSNAAYADLWGHDPAASVAPLSVAAAVAHWETRAAPDPAWARIEAALIGGAADAAPCEATVRLVQGRAVRCRVVPVPGGATLVAFAAVPARPVAVTLGDGGRSDGGRSDGGRSDGGRSDGDRGQRRDLRP